ncbi:MAG: alpha/beta fold hydrolase [Geminicoccaceae bacterium]
MSAMTARPAAAVGAPAAARAKRSQVGTPSTVEALGIAVRLREITLPAGLRLPYVEQGDPSGVPVLLLHGYTDSWRSFEGVLAHLPGSVRALALTQRGHGDADRPVEGYRPGDFAADLAAFMETLELGPAIVVGHSMGSYVAQRFALDYPERTLGLVLIGSFTTVRGNPAVVDLWASAVSKLLDPIDPDFVAEFQRSTLARPVPQTFLDTIVEESLKAPARVWRAALQGLFMADHSGELQKIRTPTLIVWGDRDEFFSRRDQDALAAAIAGSELVIYPGAGHAPQWEEPGRLAADLAAFAERVAG